MALKNIKQYDMIHNPNSVYKVFQSYICQPHPTVEDKSKCCHVTAIEGDSDTPLLTKDDYGNVDIPRAIKWEFVVIRVEQCDNHFFFKNAW